MSNVFVRRLRSLRKLLFAVSVSLFALLFSTLLASQIEQYLFRRRAELLLSQIQSLELRKTPWQEAMLQLQVWNRNSEFGSPCDVHKCSLQITLIESVFSYVSQRNIFVKLDDYFRWRLKLSYDVGPFVRLGGHLLRIYLRLGGHPAKVTAYIGMRDGVVWRKGIDVWVETYGHPVDWSGGFRLEFALLASAYSVSSLGGEAGYMPDAQLDLHPYYLIGRPGGCTICVKGWALFTPYAAPADIRRLSELNLSCLTGWGRCLTQSDIMPNAWAQYLAERSYVNGDKTGRACSPYSLEIFGRDSEGIAEVEILKYRDTVDDQGYHTGLARVRLLERLKDVKDWNVGENRESRVRGGDNRENLNLPIGSKLVLFRTYHWTEDWTASSFSCPITWANESNLSRIRFGVDQDFVAQDKSAGGP